MKSPCIALLCLLAACGGGVPGEPAHRSSNTDLVVSNGEELNGEELNGEELNGTSLGSRLVSVAFAGAFLKDGTNLDTAWLDGSMFRGTAGTSQFAGMDFEGAHFFAITDTGATVELRVKNLATLSPPDDDVWTYRVQFRSDDGWNALCGFTTTGNFFSGFSSEPIRATAVSGVWDGRRGVPGGGAKIADPSVFTLSCMGVGAIAKCISPIGYKPWKT